MYLDSVERTPKGVNVMSFVPLGPIYGYVIGIGEAKKRQATDEELKQMCETQATTGNLLRRGTA